MANASFLKAIFICIPIIFLTRTNPQAYFIVLSVVLFILSGAILVFVFVPKIVALRDRKKNGTQQTRSNVRISGLDTSVISSSKSSSKYGSASFRASMSQKSSLSASDPVKAVLQQYQAPSWENKMAVKKKLSLSSSTQPSRTLEQFESSGDIAESPKDSGSGSIVEGAENEDEVPAEVVPESALEAVPKKDSPGIGADPDATAPESPV